MRKFLFLISLVVAITSLILGALFKIQHYPGATIFQLVGFSFIVIPFLWNRFSKKSKKDIDINQFGKQE